MVASPDPQIASIRRTYGATITVGFSMTISGDVTGAPVLNGGFSLSLAAGVLGAFSCGVFASFFGAGVIGASAGGGAGIAAGLGPEEAAGGICPTYFKTKSETMARVSETFAFKRKEASCVNVNNASPVMLVNV